MKIGIVNDLPMAVEALRRALALKRGYQIAWVAKDGREAIQLAAKEKPDLILMDLIMPGMDGVEATRHIMAESPCAILVVTVSVGSNAGKVYEAMGHGALDAVDTPALGFGDPAQSAAPLLNKIDMLHQLVSDAGERRTSLQERIRAATGAEPDRLVAIGSSAGGPAALLQVLGGLPKDFTAPVVIIQHVDAQFAQGMADWLGQHCALPVQVANEGDCLDPGRVLIAGTCDHLVIRKDGLLGYTPDPKDYPYRPSVDAFFESVVQRRRGQVVGVVLTGMGRDGAIGLKALRNAGHHTIAQDKETSAVYGMPRAAAALGGAVEVLPLPRIASALTKLFAKSTGVEAYGPP